MIIENKESKVKPLVFPVPLPEVTFLPLDDFKQVVECAPLFSIDLVVLNETNQILVGQRLNAPAKDAWFVPGGRVFKNESLDQAFNRTSIAELGIELERGQASFLGLYDHFYNDSFFSEEVSTHYINAAHVVRVEANQLDLPTAQHNQYRWMSFAQIERDDLVHQYSKVFLSALNLYLEQEKIKENTDD